MKLVHGMQRIKLMTRYISDYGNTKYTIRPGHHAHKVYQNKTQMKQQDTLYRVGTRSTIVNYHIDGRIPVMPGRYIPQKIVQYNIDETANRLHQLQHIHLMV